MALTCPAVILILRSGTFSAVVPTLIPYTLNPLPLAFASLIYHGKGKGVKVKTRTSSPKGDAKEDEQQDG